MMSVKSWWHPVTVKASDIKRIGLMILIGCTLLELIVYLHLLRKNVQSLYEYNRVGEKFLITVTAAPYSDLASSPFFLYLFAMQLLLLALLPGLFFYQHYIGPKSIYTMLRLKEKKLHIRFYIENMAVSVIGIWLVLLWQFLLYCLGYLIYLAKVPSTNLPEGGALSIFQNPMYQNVFPVLKPYLWFVPIGIGLASLSCCYAGVRGYPIYIIIATVGTVGTGLFYMKCVEIV